MRGAHTLMMTRATLSSGKKYPSIMLLEVSKCPLLVGMMLADSGGEVYHRWSFFPSFLFPTLKITSWSFSLLILNFNPYSFDFHFCYWFFCKSFICF
jgi:hypothetical protein